MELALLRFSDTSDRLLLISDDPSSYHESLREYATRWNNNFQNVVSDIHQKGYLLKNSDKAANLAVFAMLTSGMDETLDRVQKGPENAEQIRQLRVRMAYHSEALSLLFLYLER
jgi:hypothetical protein